MQNGKHFLNAGALEALPEWELDEALLLVLVLHTPLWHVLPGVTTVVQTPLVHDWLVVEPVEEEEFD